MALACFLVSCFAGMDGRMDYAARHAFIEKLDMGLDEYMALDA